MASGSVSGFIVGAAVFALGAAGLSFFAGPPPERGAPAERAENPDPAPLNGETAGAPDEAEGNDAGQAARTDQNDDTAADERSTSAGSEATTDLSAPAGSRFNEAREDRPAELPSAVPPPDAPDGAPRADAPSPDAPAALEDAARRTAEVPETGAPGDAMAPPPAVSDGAGPR